MEINLSPDVQQRLAAIAARDGVTADDLARDVLNRYLADEGWLDAAIDNWSAEERHSVMERLEQSFLQSELGAVKSANQVRDEMEAMKAAWRQERVSSR